MPFFREDTKNDKKNIGIGIDIIDSCNLRCKQCYYTKSNDGCSMMSLSQVEKIITQAKNNFSELYILGGEPTLHPHLPAILEIGLRNMPTVILVTNGIMLADEKYCELIALSGLGISMHKHATSPANENIVDQLAQRRGTFATTEKAWKNISKYWQGNVCVQLNILKPLLKYGSVFDVFKWAREMNYEPIIELTKPGPIFERGSPLDVTTEEIEFLYKEMQSFDAIHYPMHRSEIIVPPSYGHNCTLIETGVHINVNGNVIPCVAHDLLPLGNIFHSSLDDILESNNLRMAIQDFQNWIVGPCRDCQYFEYCHGGCRGEAFWDTGCPRSSDPYCWYQTKKASLKDMTPKSCTGCILENHPGCKIKNC